MNLTSAAQRAQEHMDFFLSSHPEIGPFAQVDEAKIRLEPAAGNKIKLAMIYVSDRARDSIPGEPPGRAIMNELCRHCTEHGIELELLAKPLPKPPSDSKGVPTFITFSKLVAFYKQFGFIEAPGHDSTTCRAMRRKP